MRRPGLRCAAAERRGVARVFFFRGGGAEANLPTDINGKHCFTVGKFTDTGNMTRQVDMFLPKNWQSVKLDGGGGGGVNCHLKQQLCLWVKYTTQKKLKEHFDIMIFIERYPLKRCQGCVKLIASKVNCFLTLMVWVRCNYACPLTAGPESVHTKDGADHVPLFFWVVYNVLQSKNDW